MTSATAPVDALATIQSKLSETGGMAQLFGGEQNLGTFGENVKKFGENFATFAKDVSGITVDENMTSIVTIAESFAGIAERMNKLEKVYDLSDYILWLGKDLKTFFTDISDVDTSKHTAMSDFANGIADAAVKLAGIEVDSWVLTDLLSSLSTLSLPEDGYSETTKKISSELNMMISAIAEKKDAFMATGLMLGNNLISGLSNAIRGSAWKPISAAGYVANGVTRTIKSAWQIHSPSRVGYDLGENFDLAIAGGMNGSAGNVLTSAEKIGDGVILAMKRSLQMVTNLAECGIDDCPRIRPVLDMSDIESGLKAMDGMFGDSKRVGGYFYGEVAVRNANRMMLNEGRMNGRRDNQDVVEKLQELSNRFDELGQAVTNMKVVLDSGVLVGQTSRKMDRQLGILAGRKERGN